MPKLLYSATGADGKPTEGIAEASSVQALRHQLESQAMTEVVVYNAPGFAIDDAELKGLGPKQLQQLAQLRLLVMRKPGLGTALLAMLRVSWPWLVASAAMLAWGLAGGGAAWSWAGVVSGLLPFALFLWNWRHVGHHNDMLKAFALGDWAQVRRLAKLLSRRRGNTVAMNFEFALRQAYADVRERSLEQGLARMETWRARVADQPGLFEMRIAMLHHAAGDWASFVRLHEESLQHLPGDPTRTVDLALAHARHGSAERAAELLAGVERSLLPPWGGGFVLWVEGLVQLRRHEATAAGTLGKSVAAFLKLANQPLVWTAMAFATVDHALALHASGRSDEARHAVSQVWPIVQAHAHPALLRMLENDKLAPLYR